MRLFVALDLPEDVRDGLAGLAGGLPGMRWVPPANYHLTLRFIGETPAHRAEEVDEALAAIRAKPFELRLAGLGTFEKAGRVHSLHVTAERTPGLSHLQSKIETALQRAGFPAEKRRFAPHVTLGRAEAVPVPKLVDFLQTHSLFRCEPVTVEHFTLFSSQLGKEQAVYTPEADYPLAA
ncbi:RNA 2',3'-cyclic phosphodiesterase [Sabulicella rubraurantiaca]|uniref:RNA 2',3'-cyclic phosphodiesterase n=1 Tax=Sabulicella rubraurantiaca TaxID=2811429 RepID=UPI001A95DEA6|nr:RNA 2',3'-cyclic phosphodiesterase [Sabulicella rubraurantiaca]